MDATVSEYLGAPAVFDISLSHFLAINEKVCPGEISPVHGLEFVQFKRLIRKYGAKDVVKIARSLRGCELAFRADLQRHLVGPDGFTKSGQLSGTHNLDNAKAALDARGATYSVKPTNTAGVSELNYTYTNSANRKLISGNQTVYDPIVHSDTIMMTRAQQAGPVDMDAIFRKSIGNGFR